MSDIESTRRRLAQSWSITAAENHLKDLKGKPSTCTLNQEEINTIDQAITALVDTAADWLYCNKDKAMRDARLSLTFNLMVTAIEYYSSCPYSSQVEKARETSCEQLYKFARSTRLHGILSEKDNERLAYATFQKGVLLYKPGTFEESLDTLLEALDLYQSVYDSKSDSRLLPVLQQIEKCATEDLNDFTRRKTYPYLDQLNEIRRAASAHRQPTAQTV
jgi:hypothetical protein